MHPERLWRPLVVLFALGLLIVIVTRWNYWQAGPGWQSTDDAYLQSDLTPIAAKVSGYVRDVPVGDYDRVHAGQLVVQLVDDDYQAAVAQGQANVASARAQLQTLQAQRVVQEANANAADAVVASTAAQASQNGRDIARQKQLFASGSSTAEAAEKLSTTAAQLKAQLEQNRAQAAAAHRQLAVLTAQIAQAAAAVDAQSSSLRLARINLGYTRIVAPSDGVLSQRQVRVGQFVGVGGQVTTVTALPNVWVIANFKETQLAHMRVGQRARVTVDTFPGRTLKGHVLAFAPGSGAQFALLPPDNATGNFTKVVQRVPIKIAIDDAVGLADRLRPGMSVVASVEALDGRK
ncbi:MAG TPA: HlyD family secretion protein [Caulobacteraceae bacterium]|nr:HlyD family secretion protein [Caulobacteraceae bacterium]